MIIEILLGIFIIAFGVNAYIIWNLMRKQEKTEDWVTALENRVSGILTETKEIDTKGMFEADDEVGQIFSQLNSMITTLNDFILTEEEEK
jgi:methyl-accepting chemotaxis protein